MGGIIMLGGTLLLMIIGKAASFIDEKENKRKKTNEKDKSVIRVALILLTLIAFPVISRFVVIPLYQVNKAITLLDSGKNEEART